MEIYDSNGGLIVNGYGYNPVWSSDGQTLYTAGGAITEGSSAVNGWSANGGPALRDRRQCHRYACGE